MPQDYKIHQKTKSKQYNNIVKGGIFALTVILSANVLKGRPVSLQQINDMHAELDKAYIQKTGIECASEHEYSSFVSAQNLTKSKVIELRKDIDKGYYVVCIPKDVSQDFRQEAVNTASLPKINEDEVPLGGRPKAKSYVAGLIQTDHNKI